MDKDILQTMLENQSKYMKENPDTLDHIAGGSGSLLIPVIRRATAQSIASDLVGVQPMSTQTGNVFHLKYSYETPDERSKREAQEKEIQRQKENMERNMEEW